MMAPHDREALVHWLASLAHDHRHVKRKQWELWNRNGLFRGSRSKEPRGDGAFSPVFNAMLYWLKCGSSRDPVWPAISASGNSSSIPICGLLAAVADDNEVHEVGRMIGIPVNTENTIRACFGCPQPANLHKRSLEIETLGRLRGVRALQSGRTWAGRAYDDQDDQGVFHEIVNVQAARRYR